MMKSIFFHKLYQWYLYSSVRKFVIAGTDENGKIGAWQIITNLQYVTGK